MVSKMDDGLESLIYPSLHYTQHDSSLGLGIDADFLIYFTLILICKHSQLFVQQKQISLKIGMT